MAMARCTAMRCVRAARNPAPHGSQTSTAGNDKVYDCGREREAMEVAEHRRGEAAEAAAARADAARAQVLASAATSHTCFN